jgi:general secretion pathway protein I
LRADRGFTLLEIILALGILSLAVAALLPAFNSSLRLSSRAAGEREAVLFAESKLAEIGAGRIEPGSRSGRAEGALSWQSDVALTASTPAVARYSVSVTVQPAQGAPVRLSTILLGPAS